MDEHAEALAEAVRAACLRAAAHAYEQAGISGLCGEGRWEMAMQAVRELDLQTITRQVRQPRGPGVPR